MKRILIILLLIPAFLCRAYAEGPDQTAMEIFEAGQMENGFHFSGSLLRLTLSECRASRARNNRTPPHCER